MENRELPKNYIDEKTGIEYRLVEDYYIPNLILPSQKNVKLGKIKNYKKIILIILTVETKKCKR